MTQPVSVSVLNDGTSEADETFVVNLSGPSNATIADGQGTGTIEDDDVVPTLSINDVTETEGVGVTAGFTVSLSAVSGQTVTVNWATANVTAVAGSDYTSASGTVTFDPGEMTQPVSVSLLNDGTSEADETFVVNLSAPSNATITDGQGVATIEDDDAVPTVSINDVTDTEGVGATSDFTVTLSEVSGQTVTVNWATANGTALAGSDYTAASGTVTFDPGETTQPVSVSLLNDGTSEADETFVVNLSSPGNATILDASGTGTILDDDDPPLVSLSVSQSTMEEDGSDSPATISATLSAISGLDVTVDLLFGGTASFASDYSRSGTTILIPAGALDETVTVSALQDGTDEPDETVIVDIDEVTNGSENGVQQVTVTIVDDDPTMWTLAVLGGGDGSGTVTSSPGGINCTITAGTATGLCEAQYADGTVVALTGSPQTGSDFSFFSGGGCPGSGNCTVTLDQDLTLTGIFNLQQFTITLQGTGAGSGTVTSSPSGISCTSTGGTESGDCSETFAYGTSATLVASAGASAAFTGWSGSGISCPGTGNCSFTVTANRTVTAEFAVSGSSSKSGTVTATYAPYQSVDLEGSTLAIRGPACPPNGSTCVLIESTTLGSGGGYIFTGLPIGTFELEVQDYDPAIFTFNPTITLITVEGSSTTSNINGIVNPNTILGGVYYFGTPVEGMTVELVQGATVIQTTTTDAVGRYYFAVSSTSQTYTIRIVPSSVGLDPGEFAATEISRTAGGGQIVYVSFSAY